MRIKIAAIVAIICSPAAAQWIQTGTYTQSGSYSTGGVPLCQISTLSLPSADANTVYPSTQLTTVNCVAPVAFSVTVNTPPPGVSVSSTGLVSGSSSVPGLYPFTVQAVDANGAIANQPFTISITCPSLQITSPSTLPQATQNSPWVGFQFQAQGGLLPLSWSLAPGSNPWPTGIAIDASGFASGTPTNTGTFTPTVKVVDSCPTQQSATQLESLTVVPNVGPLTLTNTNPLGTCTVGISCVLPLNATGGVPPYTFSQPPGNWLPPGCTLTATNVSCSPPTGSGTFIGTLTVGDSVGGTNNGASPYQIIVNGTSNADNRYCNSSGTWTGPATVGSASAPISCYNTAIANTPATGSTVTPSVASCSSLQTAINNATAGTIISIPPLNGAGQNVYSSCNLTISVAGTSSNYIYIQSSSPSLPLEGNRLTPAWAGTTSLVGRPSFSQPGTAGIYIPKIVGNTGSGTILHFTSTAAFIRIIGINVATAAGADATQIVSIDAGAHGIILDRVWLNGADTGQSTNSVQAGLRINSSVDIALIDSTVTNIGCINGGSCGDAQGVFLGGSSAGTDGPIKIVDDFIEDAGENLFTGGGGVGATTSPATDLEIRRNHLFKPLYWKLNDPSYFGISYNVKNHFEMKNAKRLFVEGNILDQTWEGQSDQHGISVLLDSRNQSSTYTGNATTSGNTLTWNSGTQFKSASVDPACPAGGCHITFNNVSCVITSFISVTQVTVSCPSGGVSIPNNFTSVTLNAGMTKLTRIAFHPTDNPCHIYGADQLSGFWLSTDCGATWTQKNSGLPVSAGNVYARSVNYDATHSDIILGIGNADPTAGVPATFWISSNEGTSWSAIATIPGGACGSKSVPAFTGVAVTGNGTIVPGCFFGAAGKGGRGWSSDNGVTMNGVTVPVNGTCPAPGGAFSFFWDGANSSLYSGDEQCGLYISTDNGHTWGVCGPPDQNFGANPRVGNLNAIIADINDNHLIVGQGGVFRQSNSACPYTFTNPVGNPDNAQGKTLALDSLHTLYYGHGKSSNAGFQCLYFASTDNGVTWSNFCTGLPTSGGALEGDFITQNPINGQMYALTVTASNNTALLWKTTGSSDLPPQVTASFTAAVPGLNPNAVLTDAIFRYNYIRHAANGFQISNPPSDQGDLSLTNARYTLWYNVADDIDGVRWLANSDCCNYGAALQIQNQEGGAAALDQIDIEFNTFLPTYSNSLSKSTGASLGFGSQNVTGSAIGHIVIANNISAGGSYTTTSGQGCGLSSASNAQTNWNCWTPAAQKCFDNNLLTVSTLPGGGTGTFTHDNPPYPQIADNAFCPYGTAKGPLSTTDYSTVLFTTLSNANGGNYLLQSGSPGHNAASDGTDLGVPWANFQLAISGVQ